MSIVNDISVPRGLRDDSLWQRSHVCLWQVIFSLPTSHCVDVFLCFWFSFPNLPNVNSVWPMEDQPRINLMDSVCVSTTFSVAFPDARGWCASKFVDRLCFRADSGFVEKCWRRRRYSHPYASRALSLISALVCLLFTRFPSVQTVALSGARACHAASLDGLATWQKAERIQFLFDCLQLAWN